MSDSGFALSNEELTDLIRTTFVFTVLSASLDNEERDDMPQKVGEYVIEACMDDMMSNVVENTFSNKKAFDLESIDFESFIQSLDDEFDLTVERSPFGPKILLSPEYDNEPPSPTRLQPMT